MTECRDTTCEEQCEERRGCSPRRDLKSRERGIDGERKEEREREREREKEGEREIRRKGVNC